MFDDSQPRPSGKSIYRFNSQASEMGQSFSLEVLEERTTPIEYEVAIFPAKPYFSDPDGPMRLSIRSVKGLPFDSDEETCEILNKTMSQSGLHSLLESLKQGGRYEFPGGGPVLEGVLLRCVRKSLEHVFSEGRLIDHRFLPSRVKKRTTETETCRIFLKMFSLEETVAFLGEIEGRDSYEFLDDKFHIDRANVLKIGFMMGRLVDSFITDNVIGDFSGDEIRGEIDRINRKSRE